MKSLIRVGFTLWILMLASQVALAGERDAVSGGFIGGVGLGGAAPVNGFGSDYSGGAGIDGYIGFIIDRNLSALLSIDSFIFDTSNPNIYSGEANFAPSLKYAFGDSPTRVYLIGGLGINDNIAYIQTSFGSLQVSQRNFMIEPGAGVEFFLNNALDLYLQAKFIDVFAESNFSYIPISVGLCFK
ncbi:MAG TPA: outer membrane beta-barrel protein [bacterium]|nr:outer membrane beta-barrel protein [bacterium]